MPLKELGGQDALTSVGQSAFEYAILPSNAPEVIVKNTIHVRSPSQIESAVEAARRRGFQGLVRRYMNQLLYGCQSSHCNTPTCYTARKNLSRTTNASRKLTVLSSRIIACNLATRDDPYAALCPGKPVVPVMSSNNPENSSDTRAEAPVSRDSSFREEIGTEPEEDAEKENKKVVVKKNNRVVETVSDKGLKDPKSFPQQLFNTMALKMVEWIGLPPPTGAFKFAPEEYILPPTATSLRQGTKLVDFNNGREKEQLPLKTTPATLITTTMMMTGHEPPKYKFHSNPMELIDTGRLHRDSEPVSQHRHQEILQAPPRKRGMSNPPKMPLKDVITPTPHTNTAKAKITTPNNWNHTMPPPIEEHIRVKNHHENRQVSGKFMGNQHITPSKGGNPPQAATVMTTPDGYVVPPQSLGILNPEICEALVRMCHDPTITMAERKDTDVFARQSLFYVFSTPEAALKSFDSDGKGGGLGLDPEIADQTLRLLFENGIWENLVMRSLWMGMETVFSKNLGDRDAARMILIALHALAARLPRGTSEQWTATRKLRGSGRVSDAGVISEIDFEDEMAERLMKRVVRAIGYRSIDGDETVVGLLKGHFKFCGELQEASLRGELVQELGEELAGAINSKRGGWSLPVCTLEWCRAVLLQVWDGQECVKRASVAAGCLGLLKVLHQDHKSYGLEPEYFHTPTLSDRLDPKEVSVEWFHSSSSPKTVHLLDHPYIFPPGVLVTYFRAINLSHMSKAYEQSMIMARLTGQMSMTTSLTDEQDQLLLSKMRIALSTYLLIEIHRETILEDALNQIFRRELRELRRPLKVRFANEGEEGVDHGGVQQEFFIVALREALKPEFGMFTTDEKTRMSWFSICPLEPIHKYELLGLLVGLAVYNGVTLPVTFPSILYKKLLGQSAEGLEDIEDGWNELSKGLRGLLEWADGDVGDVFVRTYAFSYELFGKVKSVDMLTAEKNGVEFLEEKIEPPPPPPRRCPVEKMKEPLGKKRVTIDERDALYSAIAENWGVGHEWLPAAVPDTGEDPWSGGLIEVLSVMDREDEEEEGREERRRGYEVSYREWGEGDGSWENVEEDDEENEEIRKVENSTASSEVVVDGMQGERYARDGELLDTTPAEREGGDEEEERTVSSGGTDQPNASVAETTQEAQPSAQESDQPNPPKEMKEEDIKDEGRKEDQPKKPPDEEIATPTPSESSEVKEAKGKAKESSKYPTPLSSPLPDLASSDDLLYQNLEPTYEEAELVTNSNRHQYVQDYIAWLTDRSIRRQYTAFSRGFHAILDIKALSLFTSSSLRNLVEGIQEIDIAELEKTARYDDGYSAGHRIIKEFWSIVRGFGSERRRMLLEFVTASDRVPVGGIGSIMFVVQRNGPDSDRVPTSLTCFGRLLLPEYSSKKKLREKLKLALENGKGFGVP